MQNINIEDLKTISKKVRSMTDDPTILKYIDLIESRILHACDMVHALKVFSEGKVDDVAFKRRMKCLVMATEFKPLIKRRCDVCGSYFWTAKVVKNYCSSTFRTNWICSIYICQSKKC